METKVNAEEGYEYKRWVLVVAEKVATAAKEGGLFGFGGEQVSGSEVTIINEIGVAAMFAQRAVPIVDADLRNHFEERFANLVEAEYGCHDERKDGGS